MAMVGGYDYEFIESIPDRCICNICTKPLRDPHLVVCCGQHYCESCLNKWTQTPRRTSCPQCRVTGGQFQHVIDKKLKREIESFQVKCTNHKEGCEWIGELGSMKDHLQSRDGCGYVEVECSTGCEDAIFDNPIRKKVRKMKRNNLIRHLRIECSNRPYQCEFCNKRDTYEKITGKGYNYRRTECHYVICEEYPMECPNNCGQTHIKRKDLAIHRSQCSLERVQCPNKCAQPQQRSMLRKDLDKHLREDCYLRPYRCEYCNQQGTYIEITGNSVLGRRRQRYHYQVCPGYPLNCPNNCGIGKVKRGDLHAHRQQCPEEDVTCPNKCTVSSWELRTLKRKNLNKHTKEECMLRQYQCEHCHRNGTYSAITTHYSTCPQYPLECPNQCGPTKIVRKDMTLHHTICPREPVECPFAEAGCKLRLVRRDLENHNSTMVQQHLMMMMRAFKESKSEQEQMKRELQQTKQELVQLKRSRQTAGHMYW